MNDPKPEDQPVAKAEQLDVTPAKFKDLVEVLGKAVLYIGAFCYAVGILVESLYLGSFGVYHVSLFRFTYVFAGLWALLLFAMPVFPISTFLAQWELNKSVKHGPTYLLVFLWLIVAILGVGGFIIEVFLMGLSGIEINSMLNLTALSAISIILGLITYSSFHKDKKKEHYKVLFHFNFLTGLLSLVSFLIFLGLFSTHIFPQISARLGGGKPLTVQLLLEANKQNSWMIQKNFDLCENDKAKIAAPEEVQLIATKPMLLLLATDSDYIIRKDENIAITISRDQVKTVLYLDKIDPNKDVCGGDTPPKPAGDTPPVPAG